ncbi:hypothetical protein PTKIN_Ptkin03bG0150600 [Pterospermum kingtungense]
MPTFCYQCGLIGHNDTDCEAGKDRATNNSVEHQYRDWMRASSLKKGITFNKNASSSAKTEAFLSHLRANTSKRAAENQRPVERSGRAVDWNLGENLVSCRVPLPRVEGKQPGSRAVDCSEGEEITPINLHQKIKDLKVSKKSEEALHKEGKSACSKERVKAIQISEPYERNHMPVSINVVYTDNKWTATKDKLAHP